MVCAKTLCNYIERGLIIVKSKIETINSFHSRMKKD